MNVIRPSFYPHALAELAASLHRLAAKAAAGLQQLAGLDPQSSSVLTTGVGRYGKLMLVSRGQGFARFCKLRNRQLAVAAHLLCCPRNHSPGH